MYQYFSVRVFLNSRYFVSSAVWLLRLLGTNRLIVDAIRSDATDVAEEINYLTAISDKNRSEMSTINPKF